MEKQKCLSVILPINVGDDPSVFEAVLLYNRW